MTGSTLHAKGEIGLFLAVVFVLSALFYGLLFVQPGAPPTMGRLFSGVHVVSGCCCHGHAVSHAPKVRGLGWGWDGLRYYLLAYGLPIAICLAAYLPVWLGFDAFRPEALAEAATKLRLPAGVLGNLGLALFVLTQPLLGMIGSLGEELVTKLVFLKPISGKSCGTRNALRQPQGRIALPSRLMKPM